MSVAAGCGSSASTPAPAPITDPMTAPASAATTSTLGVTTWGVNPVDATHTIYTGYDALNAARLTITQDASVDAKGNGESRIDFHPRDGADATMHIIATAQTFTLDQNTFAGNDAANAAVKAMGADLKAASLKGPGSGGQATLTQSAGIHLDEAQLSIGGGQCLVASGECLTLTGVAGSALSEALSSCGVPLLAGVGVLVCQVGGLGPEDPLADFCSAAAGAVSKATITPCVVKALAAGGAAYGARDICVKACASGK